MKLKAIGFYFYQDAVIYYTQVLQQFFGQVMEIESVIYHNDGSLQEFEADIVLYTMHFIEDGLRRHNKNPRARYLNMCLTIHGKYLAQLRTLPSDADLLLMSSSTLLLWETIATIRSHGITHLHMIPYHGQRLDVTGITYAAYLGIKTFEPLDVKHYVDLGWRLIHPYVLRVMAEIAAVPMAEFEALLQTYVGDGSPMLPYEDCLRISWDSALILERSTLLNILTNPAFLLDDRWRVQAINESYREIFRRDFEGLLNESYKQDPLLTGILNETAELGGSGIYTHGDGQRFRVVEIKPTVVRVAPYFQRIFELIPLEKSRIGVQSVYRFGDIIYRSNKMRHVLELARHFSESETTILIEGESGTGKELLAHAIHHASKRSYGPFVAVNCGAFTESLLESELFGYVGGAFTGALREGKKGLLEQADRGTIFLDEIGEASLKLQVRLLRFLQGREVQPVGSNIVRRVDVRVICATNVEMERAVAAGVIREDLFYRISPVTLFLPPLRERIEDIEPLLEYFLKPGIYSLSRELRKFIQSHPWKGNTRELKGCAEYMMSFGTRQLDLCHLPVRYQKMLAGNDVTPPVSGTYSESREIHLGKQILMLLGEKPCGRRKLAEALQALGISCTEYEIRQILSELQAQALVHIGIGRGATTVTQAGRQYLQSQGILSSQ